MQWTRSSKIPNLKDNPVSAGQECLWRSLRRERSTTTKLPEVHDASAADLRKVADEYNAVLIGETWTDNIAELKQYYGEHNNELQMPMDFLFTTVNKLSPAGVPQADCGHRFCFGGWPTFVISNHDIVRSYDRYGDGQHNDQIAKLMAGLYLTLRGTPIMYYGEEIGMENNDPDAQGRCERSDRAKGMAEGEGPRRRAHSDAVGRKRQWRILNRRSLASRAGNGQDPQRRR